MLLHSQHMLPAKTQKPAIHTGHGYSSTLRRLFKQRPTLLLHITYIRDHHQSPPKIYGSFSCSQVKLQFDEGCCHQSSDLAPPPPPPPQQCHCSSIAGDDDPADSGRPRLAGRAGGCCSGNRRRRRPATPSMSRAPPTVNQVLRRRSRTWSSAPAVQHEVGAGEQGQPQAELAS
jgi:hypothetical protein